MGKTALALLVAMAALTGSAQALVAQQVGSGFEEPVYVTSDPGDAERLFVVERQGVVLLVEDGEVKPFADISAKVSTEGERGLLSIALPADFDLSGRFYLDYTGKAEPGEIHVAEMVASGDSAPSGTLRDVIAPIPHKQNANHNGGQLQLGPGGALFVSTGDGGGNNDQLHNAQNPASLLGKILRVQPNPSSLATPEVWSLGLRNPFRFSFDRLTGAMLIGDVGQSAREEIDYAPAPGIGEGANYGWNCREGRLPGPGTDPQCALLSPASFVEPIFDYPHADPGNGGAWGQAVIGGYVARGAGMGDLYGRYLYGDLGGDVRSFALGDPYGTDCFEGLHVANLNSFGEDSAGRLYLVSGDGPVYRLGAGQDSCAPQPAAPQYQPALSPSYVGIRAVSRKVRRHRRGLITTWVAPCPGRRGDPVTLWRGRRRLGTRYLDRACSARFRPRIDRRAGFRVTIRGDSAFLPAISRKVTIKPVRRH